MKNDADYKSFEAVSPDIGAVAAGFIGNAAFAGLTVGEGASIGMCAVDNRWDTAKNGYPDAVYVRNLKVGPGSTLQTNGYNVYYLYADIDPTATISGALTEVALPCADLVIIQANPADLNKDCRINFADFALFAEQWLVCYDISGCP